MAQVEQERDKLFDHEYDGIREYDNPMPKWWVYIFIATAIFAYPYIVYYHFGQGPSIQDQLAAEREAYAQQLLATYGDLQPDEATLLTFMHDDVAMTGMAGLFKGKCAQCHLADGSGSVGPNLTDEAWINVKRITDIAELVTHGRPGKGMPAWGDRLTQTQIVLLSSYVAQLRNNPIPGKEPQGNPIPPWPAAAADVPAEGAAAQAEEAVH
jgi:cytochrome c oxidase cbb3-type subunit 3